jgi:hypothetical protein
MSIPLFNPAEYRHRGHIAMLISWMSALKEDLLRSRIRRSTRRRRRTDQGRKRNTERLEERMLLTATPVEKRKKGDAAHCFNLSCEQDQRRRRNGDERGETGKAEKRETVAQLFSFEQTMSCVPFSMSLFHVNQADYCVLSLVDPGRCPSLIDQI